MIPSANQLNQPAQAILQYLQEKRPAQASLFLQHLPAARLTIMERLVNALVREKLAHPVQRNTASATLTLQKAGATLIFPVRFAAAFDKVTLCDFPFYWHHHSDQVIPVNEPEQLFRYCVDPTAAWLHYEAVAIELSESCAQMAWSMCQPGEWARETPYPPNNLAVYLSRQVNAATAYLLSEQLYVHGHPLQPGAKIRTGFSLPEVIAYTPEFRNLVNIRWAAVRRDHLVWCAMQEEESMAAIHSLVPGGTAAWQNALQQLDADPSAYLPMPMHEWQFLQVLPVLYREEIAARTILPLPALHLSGQAGISVRTVFPVNGGQLKLSLNIQLTGNKRTITPQTICNGPIISQFFGEILEKDHSYFHLHPVGLLQEQYGACLQTTDREKACNLGFLWREDLQHLLRPGERVIVSALLAEASPLSGQPVVADYIQLYAAASASNTPVLDWWNHYLDTLLFPALFLLTRYGIALEAHTQNALTVFQDGRPVKQLFRDWGGLRIHSGRLQNAGYSLALAPQSLTITEALPAVHNKLLHSLFQIHIGELARHISRAFPGTTETVLWQQAAQKTLAVYEVIETSYPSLRTTIEADKAALFSNTICCKAIFSMRLSGVRKDTYYTCSNPLQQAVTFNYTHPSNSLTVCNIS